MMTYTQVEEGASQYDDYDFRESKVVDAAYIPAALELDRGNPYIEALPLPRTNEAVNRAYTTGLLNYRYDNVASMSKLNRMLEVGSLRVLRFPLPFHSRLEFEFYNAILISYRSRMQRKSGGSEYQMEDQAQKSSTILLGDSAGATNAGFSLIGYSGCGKSSAIRTLTEHYPQVIIHDDGNGGYYPQIVYLVVNCVANSNFAALYEGIGNAIDRALENTIPVYATEISKTQTLGRKAEKIRQYVEQFAIGMIIFDEIQMIDFAHTRENTFDSLMTLANRTKVAIAVVGTEDARDKMFKELQTSRRIGSMINANYYCQKAEFFQMLVKSLFRYQWFDQPVEPTQEIVDALYDVTKGIVDQLIGVYSCMCYDYLDRQKRPVVNAEYVRSVAKRYYPGMQSVLSNLTAEGNENKMLEAQKHAEQKVKDLVDKARQEEELKNLKQSHPKDERAVIECQNVVSTIRAIYDEYSEQQIHDAFKKVMDRKTSEGKTEREITRLVVKQLESNPKKRTSKKQDTMSTVQLQNFLGINEE